MPRTGLEPARLSTLAPETSASTIPPPGQALYDVVVICSRVGAANETRTRDPDLGKVVLYQLSYCRKMMFQPAVHHVKVIGNPLIAGAKVLLFLELARDSYDFFRLDTKKFALRVESAQKMQGEKHLCFSPSDRDNPHKCTRAAVQQRR